MFFLRKPHHPSPSTLWLAALTLCLVCGLTGCSKSGAEAPSPGDATLAGDQVACLGATTSWLECCLLDLMGDQVKIVRLSPPGQCPGHFDMKPSVLKDIQACQALFRFDFQSALDRKLANVTDGRLRMIAIDAPEGLCLPGGYRNGLRQVQAALVEIFPEKQVKLDQALADAETRLTALEIELRSMMADSGLKVEGLQVAASGHQEAFCRWLGLDPVVTFSGANASAPAQIEALIAQGREAGIRFVITNQQESRQMGEALAWQFKATEVSFSNFPRMADGEQTYGDLLRNNVKALIKAIGQSPTLLSDITPREAAP